MARTVGVGIQSFEAMIQNNYYYVDKTLLIKELLDLKGKVNFSACFFQFSL